MTGITIFSARLILTEIVDIIRFSTPYGNLLVIQDYYQRQENHLEKRQEESPNKVLI